MSRRIQRDELLIKIALLVAQRSTCLRRNVGAVVALNGRIISTGYNGAPAGLPHCDSKNCGPKKPCKRTIHAEANAIAFAARHGVELEGAEMYTTESPCNDCAKLIINSGIRSVWYYYQYRDTDPLKLLEKAGLYVHGWVDDDWMKDA